MVHHPLMRRSYRGPSPIWWPLALVLTLGHGEAGAPHVWAEPPPVAPPAPPAPPAAPAPPKPTEEEAARELELRRRELEARKAALPPEASRALALLEEFRARELRLWELPHRQIVALGVSGVPALLVALEEIDWEVRAFAAACLETLRAPEALRPLATALGKETYGEGRRRLVRALAALRHVDAAPALRAAARDADGGVALAAVQGLGALQKPATEDELRAHLELLTELARHKEIDVRYEALGSLMALGEPTTRERLLAQAKALVADKDDRRRDSRETADHRDRYTQYLLGLVLARSGDEATDKLLGDVLEGEKPWERKTFLRLGAAEGLGRRAERGGTLHPRLVKGLRHDDNLVRVACSYGLGFVGSPELVAPLTKALADSQLEVRANAIRALARVGTPEAAQALRKALKDRSPDARLAVVHGLASVSHEVATQGLLEALDDEKYVLRVLAARALGRRTAQTGVGDALARAAADPDFGVRAQALASLAEWRGHASDVLPVLLAGLKDEDAGVQANACLALRTLVTAEESPPPLDEGVWRRVVTLLTETPAARVQRAAEELVDALRPPLAVGSLLATLESDKQEVRRRGHASLVRISESTQGYAADGPPPERAAAVQRWRTWWAAQGGKLPARQRRAGLVITGPWAEQARDLKWRGLDVALLLDSTGSMAGLLRAAKQSIDELIAELGSPLPSLRVSLYTYRDFGDDYVFYGTPLTYDLERLPGFLQSFVHGQGGDIPEAVSETIMDVFDKLEWRKDAHKVLIYAGDAPHHPDTELLFLQSIQRWATPQNRAVMHAIFTDTNRRSLDVAKRKQRADPDDFKHPYVEVYKRTTTAGRGLTVLMDDESTLIREILVLAFGPIWRADIENFLDFR